MKFINIVLKQILGYWNIWFYYKNKKICYYDFSTNTLMLTPKDYIEKKIILKYNTTTKLYIDMELIDNIDKIINNKNFNIMKELEKLDNFSYYYDYERIYIQKRDISTINVYLNDKLNYCYNDHLKKAYNSKTEMIIVNLDKNFSIKNNIYNLLNKLSEIEMNEQFKGKYIILIDSFNKININNIESTTMIYNTKNKKYIIKNVPGTHFYNILFYYDPSVELLLIHDRKDDLPIYRKDFLKLNVIKLKYTKDNIYNIFISLIHAFKVEGSQLIDIMKAIEKHDIDKLIKFPYNKNLEIKNKKITNLNVEYFKPYLNDLKKYMTDELLLKII